MSEVLSLALLNFESLRIDTYPGRGIVIGLDELNENLVQIYWIMGRSENSRNRRFAKDDRTGKLWTEPADPSKVTDPSLIIYTAMREDSRFYAVSNGKQTDDIIDAYCGADINAHEAFHKAMFENKYEPDKPNFTPRISAVFYFNPEFQPALRYAEMSIIRKSRWCMEAEQHFYPFSEFEPGFGFCITTYDGLGDPLPAFSGSPYPLPLNGDIETITKKYWDILNPDNTVSLATKFINMKTGKSEIMVINKY